MPQLDILTFSSQFSWFLFFFLLIYFRLVNTFLPKIALMTKLRKKIKEIEIKNINNLKTHTTQQKTNFETKLKQNFSLSEIEYKKLIITSENQTKKFTKIKPKRTTASQSAVYTNFTKYIYK
jgi:hypothetical protein